MNIHVIDTETTGLDPATCRVVEVAAVEVENSAGDAPWSVGVPVSSFVNPQCPIPPEASGIHHIVDEDVAGAPWLGVAISKILPEWERVVDVVAAHNAKFDKPFLPPLKDKRWICTWRCAMHCFPDAPSFANGSLFYWLGFKRGPVAQPHRAAYDAWMTAHILCRLLDDHSVDDLLKLSRKAVVLKKVSFGKHFGQLWAEVPDSYLAWCSGKDDFDPDVKFTVKTELARRAAQEQT